MQWTLFEGISTEQERAVLRNARRRRFAKREVLFHEGDPATSLHLIASGRVLVRVTTSRGDSATVALLSTGDALGEMALLAPGGRRAGTAMAIERTETLAVDADDFHAVRREVPAITELLVTMLANRVRDLDERLLEALYLPAERRLLRRLIELTTEFGERIPLTQDDLAGMAGTTRATVNRVLGEQARAGILSLSRGVILVIDRETLSRRAQ